MDGLRLGRSVGEGLGACGTYGSKLVCCVCEVVNVRPQVYDGEARAKGGKGDRAQMDTRTWLGPDVGRELGALVGSCIRTINQSNGEAEWQGA